MTPEWKISPGLSVVLGDITKMRVEAMVNAANSSLLGGGGVDGAIHRAAGPELLKECRSVGGCPTGEARITRGYDLPAAWVIHTVGPVWRGGDCGEEEMLACCYRSCFSLVEERGIKSVAFPAISTGAYGFPARRAAGIAVQEMILALEKGKSLKSILAVCYSPESCQIYLDALEACRKQR
ncbi:MAG: O-acetyl-ADP-ribose deacetylase [Methanosarcinales archaeon]|nr:O-acetyl-ADP-ribose deacetylase [Methanosarcinales archaeon]